MNCILTMGYAGVERIWLMRAMEELHPTSIRICTDSMISQMKDFHRRAFYLHIKRETKCIVVLIYVVKTMYFASLQRKVG